MKIILVIILILALGVATYKWFVYYCAVRGLLYYLEIEHSDMPDEKKAKELTNMAIERTIKEFFGQV
ncbi:hypothetical protein [Clostridium perfringens]|uniref:hypothetical protein n=1 Tax=Clostridium perfringens TaxID=1502 RepID=UPI0023F7AAE1|nr:hypothetical protein [Clostridium perfringens]WEV23404.1 hypothetical protein PL327_06845 [Clostridium perfringens D]